MKNFDLFIGIDWSGSKAVNTKSIAVSEVPQGNIPPKLLPDIRSRTSVFDYILNLANTTKRILIGIDANFGYSHKVGEKHFGQNYTYLDQWKIVDEYSKENFNFYAGGFWNHSKFTNDFWQNGKAPHWFYPETLRRKTEIQCIADGYGHPESPFKIIGAKQVGKGGLAAQRMAYALKQKIGDKLAVWPFEDTDKAQIIMTEIYPRQFIMRAKHGTTKLKTLADLNKILPYFNAKPIEGTAKVSDHDTDALVSAVGLRYLCGQDMDIPRAISNPPSMDDLSRRCEGWIFGVGDKE